MEKHELEAAQGLARTVLGICPDAEEVALDGEVVLTREEAKRD